MNIINQFGLARLSILVLLTMCAFSVDAVDTPDSDSSSSSSSSSDTPANEPVLIIPDAGDPRGDIPYYEPAPSPSETYDRDNSSYTPDLGDNSAQNDSCSIQ